MAGRLAVCLLELVHEVCDLCGLLFDLVDEVLAFPSANRMS